MERLPETAALGVLLLLISTIDLQSRRLPDWLTLPLLVLGLALTSVLDPSNFPFHLLAALLGFLSFYLIATFYRRVRGFDGLGLGDAKLLAAAGARLGRPISRRSYLSVQYWRLLRR